MIIVERTYDFNNPAGGPRLTDVTRKVFSDDDIIGIQDFLNERSKISGYEWYNLDFKFTKI